MDHRTILRVLLYTIGGLLSIALTVAMCHYIYKYTMASFEYGKNLGNALTAERESMDVTITTDEPTSLAEMSRILEENNVIENAIVFRLENILKGNTEDFPAGEFTVNAAMDNVELTEALHKTNDTGKEIKITIVEGYTLSDIADYLESQEVITAAEFLEACDTGTFSYSFLKDVPERENRLQGYLFPDTYFLSPNADAYEIINKMLTRFEDVYDGNCRAQAERLGMTMDDVVIRASIIEREVRLPEERVKVAAVIRNRLSQDMPLEMCSTVEYAIQKGRLRLTAQDLKTESPYNTYVNKGLPAGPIGNPGLACMQAALNPEGSDILYFVLTDPETGVHEFTNNYDAFVAAKELYQQVY